MANSASAKEKSGQDVKLGFLTVIEVADRGFLGGLLVTTITGRPLEFQCTMPVSPNRTQQILYGPTLGPFVKGELIGKTLVDRIQIKPALIMCDQLDILGLRNHVETPVIVLKTDELKTKPSPDEYALRAHNRHEIYALQAHTEDLAIAAEILKHVPPEADLTEPLARTTDALRETLRAGNVA